MTSISTIRSAENTSLNESINQSDVVKNENSDGSDFDLLLRGMLRPNAENQVNEEEMFAGLVHERLKSAHGSDVADQYDDLLAGQKEKLANANGYIPLEDAAKGALRSLRELGAISSEEADKVYSESFEAAQLDGNSAALYDGRGGAGDTTIALALMESALSAAQLKIDGFDAGDITATYRSLDEGSNSKNAASVALTPNLGIPGDASAVSEVNTPNGTLFDGPDGFLFKPESSADGTLAILLPESLAYNVLSVMIADQAGNTIEEGRSTGYGELGTREKFAFTKPGSDYSSNLTVEARLSDGSTRQWLIADPSQRYD